MDTGPGIQEEFRDRIFDRFFRIELARETPDGAPSGSAIGSTSAGSACDGGVGTTLALLAAAPRGAAEPLSPLGAGEAGRARS
jgi:signal transduction histidine kinase